MSRQNAIITFFTCGLAACLVMTGCISVKSGKLLKINPKRIETPRQKVIIDYDLVCLYDGKTQEEILQTIVSDPKTPDKLKMQLNSVLAEKKELSQTPDPITQKAVEKVLKESKMFSQFNSGRKDSRYHITVLFDYCVPKKSPLITRIEIAITAGLAYAAFFVLPYYCGETSYHLSAEVKENGSLLKKYDYSDSTKLWGNGLLVFAMPFCSPNKVDRKLRENMLWHFIQDVQADNLLKTNGP